MSKGEFGNWMETRQSGVTGIGVTIIVLMMLFYTAAEGGYIIVKLIGVAFTYFFGGFAGIGATHIFA